MGLEEDFLRAIVKDPLAEAQRLLYADWLEEHDQHERAEFIRVQIELAQPFQCDWEASDGQPCPQYNARRGEARVLVECPTCYRRKKMVDRQRSLLIAANFWEWFHQGWLKEWPGSPAVSFKDFSDQGVTCEVGYFNSSGDSITERWTLAIQRGFLTGLLLPLRTWLMSGLDIIRHHPLERVAWHDWPKPLERAHLQEDTLVDGVASLKAVRKLYYPRGYLFAILQTLMQPLRPQKPPLEQVVPLGFIDALEGQTFDYDEEALAAVSNVAICQARALAGVEKTATPSLQSPSPPAPGA